ncbi:PREDICTED: aspartyl aminopeptidase-like [Acropora digitifera]|uniref:aspartyl aminopeptidase-like n=1 Tax=Acropora digitifera TaxID=70779 RepID=UPI00077AB7A5|nr:PREDICTED: aspartyl aminopeptidase-like [Acropora digitifera]
MVNTTICFPSTHESLSHERFVDECRKVLVSAGFRELKEKDHWDIKPNDQVKPNSKKSSNGYQQVGVECYGGGIWATWFDRDLKVAGRAMIKKEGKLEHHLLHVKQPIMRVPHLAIHLQRDINDKFSPNKETHIAPILSTCAYEELLKSASVSSAEEGNGEKSSCRSDFHQSELMKLLSQEIGCDLQQILDFDLHLADTQPATLGGVLEEFIFSPRLDNQVSCFCALQGLVESLEGESLALDPNIRVIALYDNEEKSEFFTGDHSSSHQPHSTGLNFGEQTGTSVSLCCIKPYIIHLCFQLVISRRLVVLHMGQNVFSACLLLPTVFRDKHEENHKPALHKGPAIKINSNQRYATTAVSSSIIRLIAEQNNLPIQEYCVRNDSPCGSTIGPILSARLGLLTLDIGGPQLSMHSIREMCCSSIIYQETQLFKNFFNQLPSVLGCITGAD